MSGASPTFSAPSTSFDRESGACASAAWGGEGASWGGEGAVGGAVGGFGFPETVSLMNELPPQLFGEHHERPYQVL